MYKNFNYCPTKEKSASIQVTYINAGAVEDNGQPVYIKGRINCDASLTCDRCTLFDKLPREISG